MDNKEIYEKFDWNSLTEAHLEGKIKKILNIIPDDVSNILDVGCGNGVITNIIGEKYDVTAVDRSEHALEYVKTNKIKAEADNIPLNDSTFDLVFSSELLEHLEDNVLRNTILEIKRLSKKYILITVPNDENPDKLSIECPNCDYIYNRPNHLRSFKKKYFESNFPEFKILSSFAFGKKVRYYNKQLLKIKRKFTPANSWVPYYWISKEKRNTICPNCEHSFNYEYKFNPVSSLLDLINVVFSPKKPYWLFVLMKKE